MTNVAQNALRDIYTRHMSRMGRYLLINDLRRGFVATKGWVLLKALLKGITRKLRKESYKKC